MLTLPPSDVVYVSILSIVAGACTFAVLNPKVQDTLMQRVALSILVFGCVGEINAVIEKIQTDAPVWALLVGVSLLLVIHSVRWLKQ